MMSLQKVEFKAIAYKLFYQVIRFVFEFTTPLRTICEGIEINSLQNLNFSNRFIYQNYCSHYILSDKTTSASTKHNCDYQTLNIFKR